MQVVCWKCKKPATLVGDWHHCETCLPPPLKKRKCELNTAEKSLMMANDFFSFGTEKAKEWGDDAKRRQRA